MATVTYRKTPITQNPTAPKAGTARLLFCDSEGTITSTKKLVRDRDNIEQLLAALPTLPGPSTPVALPTGKGNKGQTWIVGLGSGSLDDLRLAGWHGTCSARGHVKALSVLLPQLESSSLEEDIEALAYGAFRATYVFDKFLTDKTPTLKLHFHHSGDSKTSGAIRDAGACADGCNWARELVNMPANHKNPVSLAAWLKSAAAICGLKVQVLDEKKLKNLGAGAILGVGQGSKTPPRLIILKWMPNPKEAPIALVGKGITFDSGGLSLKIGPNAMFYAYADMGGAAAVAGAVINAARLKLKQNVIAVIAAAENMPDSAAQRPGDIVETLAGIKVQIGSTDAEGRLVLADALAWVNRQHPEIIVDAATLTGNKMMALGDRYAAALSNMEPLTHLFRELGDVCGERAWPMPLPQEYIRWLDGPFADIRNGAANKQAGCITAAGFLSQFVGETPWVHLDIAGSAFSKEGNRPLTGQGGTGFGAYLLTEFLRYRAAGGDLFPTQ